MLGNRQLLSADAAVGRRLSSGESAKTFTGLLQTREKQFLSDLLQNGVILRGNSEELVFYRCVLYRINGRRTNRCVTSLQMVMLAKNAVFNSVIASV